MAQQTLTDRQKWLLAHKTEFFQALGDSGVLIQNGIISREEYLIELQGKNGLEIFNKMRRSDGTVRAALMAIILTILAADWHVQETSDRPEDMLAKQLVEQSLFKNIDFDDFARQAMSFLAMGYSVFEQEFDTQLVDGREYATLKKMGFRKQTTIERWLDPDESGNPGIEQRLINGHLVEIPGAKLTRFTLDQEGDNYEGISLLRAAYKHWYMKTELELIDAMAIEKQGLGVLKVRTPNTAKEGDKKKAREIAEEQRANESNYIEEEEGYSFDFMDMKARTAKDAIPSIQYQNRQILQSVLVQFLDIGSTGSSGSLAASENQIDLFYRSTEAIAKEFAQPVNDTVIRNILAMNGLSVDEAPKLAYGRIGQDAISSFSEALNKLFISGALTPDPDVEQYLREFLHLPDMTPEMRENYDDIRGIRRNPSAAPQDGQTPQARYTTGVENPRLEAKVLVNEARQMRDRLRRFANGTTTR